MDKGALQECGTLQLKRQMPYCGKDTLLSIIIQFKHYYGKDVNGVHSVFYKRTFISYLAYRVWKISYPRLE